MATTLSGTLSIQSSVRFDSGSDVSTLVDILSAPYSATYADGTGANQANRIFRDRRTLAASTSEELDLAGGITDPYGTAITMARVKAIIIVSAAANGDVINVGGAAANAFASWVGDATDKIVLRPGACFALAATEATGYAVTAGTGDLLKIENADSGDSATYDIIIIGASA